MASFYPLTLIALLLVGASSVNAGRNLLQNPPICDAYSAFPNQCFAANGMSSTCCPNSCSDTPGATPACKDGAQGIAPGTSAAPPPVATPASTSPSPTPASTPASAPPAKAPAVAPAASNQYNGFPEFAGNSALDVSSAADSYHPTLKFAVIGDVGRVRGTQSEGAPQCPVSSFNDNDTIGGEWQQTTAKLLGDVCNSEKCAFVVNTGDNFYECGVYPGDSSRLQTDIFDVYNPYVSLENLQWASTLGNHDMVINGSMEQQMQFGSAQWFLPAANFVRDFSFQGVSVRAIFYDENPWIAKYASGKYHTGWFINHSNQVYADKVVSFVENALQTSTSTHTIIVSHYPLFGSAVEYGRDPTQGLFNVFPRIVSLINQYKPVAFFNGHDHILTLGAPGNFSNGYTSYVTTGAGSQHGYSDYCGPNKQYSNGGDGGFVVVEATATTFTTRYYTTGPMVGEIDTEGVQCTVTSDVASKTTAVGSDCAAHTPKQPADGSTC